MTPDQIEEGLRIAFSLVSKWEGLRLSPYLCPAGVPTIGYGSTYYSDGTKVTLQDTGISKEEAERLCKELIEKDFLPEVIALCPTLETPQQLAAILDFAYNLGTDALRRSTLRQVILSKNWAEVPTQLSRWTKSGGKMLPGLVSRRADEIKVFKSCSPSNIKI